MYIGRRDTVHTPQSIGRTDNDLSLEHYFLLEFLLISVVSAFAWLSL